MATLADVIRKRRSSGQTRTGSLMGSLKDKVLESIDPRQFIDQSGIMTALFPSLKKFTAGSSVKNDNSRITKKSVELLRSNVPLNEKVSNVSLNENHLDKISVNMEIIAKNSLSLPGLASDMNIMRQNVVRLVKSLGANSTNEADAFFEKSSEREAEFESKVGPIQTLREQEPSEPKPESFVSSILGMIKKIVTPILAVFKTLISSVLTTIKTALSLIVTPLMGIIVGVFTSLTGILTGFISSLLLKISGLFKLISSFSFLKLLLGSFFASPAALPVMVGLLVALGLGRLAAEYGKNKELSDEAIKLREKINNNTATQSEIDRFIELADQGTFISEQRSREVALKSQLDKFTSEFILNNINSENESDKNRAKELLRPLGVSPEALRIYYEMVYGEKSNASTKKGMSLSKASELMGERQTLVTDPESLQSPEQRSATAERVTRQSETRRVEEIDENLRMIDFLKNRIDNHPLDDTTKERLKASLSEFEKRNAELQSSVGETVTPSPERDNNQGSSLNQGFRNLMLTKSMSENQNPQSEVFMNQNNSENNRTDVRELPDVYNKLFIFNYLTPSENN